LPPSLAAILTIRPVAAPDSVKLCRLRTLNRFDRQGLLNGEMNVRKLMVCNCLIACYLFSCCVLSAQNVSPLPPASTQKNVEPQPVASTDLTSPAGSESAAAVAEENSPAADPQSQGNGNANGNGTVNQNGNLNANRSKPAPAATTTYTFPTNGQIGE